MEKSPLIEIVSTLSKQNLRELRKFVRSPFFNQRDDVARLFDFLAEHASQPENLRKETVFAAVFPERAAQFDDLLLRHAMSMLFQHIKHYLAYRHWSDDAGRAGLDLCHALQQRGLDDMFEKELARTRQRLDAAPTRNADFYHLKYQLELAAWDFSRKKQRSGGDLSRVDEAFAAYVATNQLRHRAASLAQESVSGHEKRAVAAGPPPPFLAAAERGVEAGDFAAMPAVLLYYHSCKAMQSIDNEAHFRELAALLDAHWRAFPQPEMKDLWTLVLNFCIRQINAGGREYLREAFNLYRTGLERGILLENGLLSKFTYNNVLLSGLALGEWDWSLDFLEKYRPLLPARERESAYRYNLAVYWFRRPDYDRVLEILRTAEFREPLHNLDARRMLLRIYFERQEWQVLESHLESFKQYLSRHRDIGYHRDLNRNLIDFTKKLLRLAAHGEGSRERLRASISASKLVAERAWLLQQLD